MDRIAERLWIGNGDDGRNADALKAAGITAVLNATTVSDGWSGDPQIDYVRLNQDDGTTIPRETLDRAREFLERAVQREGRAVLIHCAMGVSRAATFSIFWLMCCGFGWDEAERLVRRARGTIEPNPALKASVLAYFGRSA